MTTQIENDLLFDDVTALENTLGESGKSLASLTADCDCSSYTAFHDNEDADTTQGF
jgi:hypothetical protein